MGGRNLCTVPIRFLRYPGIKSIQPNQFMTPKLSLVIICFIACVGALAQERIDTDRPDQTESSYLVPKKFFQAEFGMGIENDRFGDFSLIHPTFLLKYGLFKKVELRLEGTFMSHYEQMIPQTKTTTSFLPLEIGTKLSLWEQKSVLPKTSMIAHLGLPFTGSHYDGRQHLSPSFRFLFQNSITDHFGLGYNLGAEWDGYSNNAVWIYTISPGFDFWKNWYGYVEAFGFHLPGGKMEHNLDGGLAYYISKNSKVDISAGLGLGEENPLCHYIALGFSFRVPTTISSRH
jgi:Putative MetA-pathway of phenol degradation